MENCDTYGCSASPANLLGLSVTGGLRLGGASDAFVVYLLVVMLLRRLFLTLLFEYCKA